MPTTHDDVEFVYDSRTMTAEQILAEVEKMEEMEASASSKSYADEPNALVPARAPEPRPYTTSPVPPVESGDELAVDPAGSETPAADSETADTDPQSEKHKGGFQRKISKLNAEKGELESKLAERDRELAELKARLAVPPAAKAPEPKPPEPVVPAAAKAEPTAPEPAPAERPAPVEDPEPSVDDFDDYGAYTKAAARWAVRDERRQEEARKAAAQPKPTPEAARSPAEAPKPAEDAERTERWNEQMVKARTAHPDLDEVFSKSHPQPISNGVMWNTLQSLDDGAELGYYLATHPDESIAIEKLTRVTETSTPWRVTQAFSRAALELGKIRERIDTAARREPGVNTSPEAKPAAQHAPPQAAPATAEPQPPAPKPNGAPARKPVPPPPPIVGSRAGGGYKSLRQLSDQEIRDMDPYEYDRRMNSGEGS